MKPKDPKFVKARSDYQLNQTAPIFHDRRTKRSRDKTSNKRKSIQDSLENG